MDSFGRDSDGGHANLSIGKHFASGASLGKRVVLLAFELTVN